VEPKIVHEIVSDTIINMMTDGGSVCELSTFGQEKHKEFLTEYGFDCPYPLFFFHRIKSRNEGSGHGTVLMERLVKICDENGFAVINPINPYGRMNLEQLKEWFGKYGFIEVFEEVVVRFPKEG